MARRVQPPDSGEFRPHDQGQDFFSVAWSVLTMSTAGHGHKHLWFGLVLHLLGLLLGWILVTAHGRCRSSQRQLVGMRGLEDCSCYVVHSVYPLPGQFNSGESLLSRI